MCSRALSLCAVFQSLRRSHASQVERVRASKCARKRGKEGGEEKREKHEAGNRDGMRNACRTFLLHSSTCINGQDAYLALVVPEVRKLPALLTEGNKLSSVLLNSRLRQTGPCLACIASTWGDAILHLVQW